jgi:hypothetical protein
MAITLFHTGDAQTVERTRRFRMFRLCSNMGTASSRRLVRDPLQLETISMPDTLATISLDDPAYSQAIRMLTAATAAATAAADGDAQPAVRALAFVLSLYVDADASIATNRAIRARGEEVGKVVAGQVRWMRENRDDENEPMLHAMMRAMAKQARATVVN